MVFNTQNYWVLDFLHRPVFQKIKNTTFRKEMQFPKRRVF
jgi:hypothetical protein